MNEWFKKVFGQIKDLWSKWKLSQKIIFFAIIAVVIVALVLTITLSTRSTETILYNAAFSDDKTNEIIMCLNEENIEAQKNPAGLIVVKDKSTAKKAKSILNRKGVTDDFDPWVLFDMERWSTTDFERDVNLQRSVQAQLKNHIESYDDVDNANVIISMPKKSVYSESQEPVSVSVVLSLKPGSDFASNKKAIKSIQRTIVKAVAGLKDENVSITDTSGVTLNDFEGMADIERVDITKKELKLISDLEREGRKKILASLQDSYSSDRVRNIDMKIEMDMSEEEYSETTYSAIERKKDNPKTPYDDSDITDSLTISSEEISKKWTGSPINPEGPAGVEGQNPPVYADMNNMYATSEEKSLKKNEALNSKQTHKIVHPKPGKRTVSVAIDGTWEFDFDESGDYIIENQQRKRHFVPLSEEDITNATRLIKGAIGYDEERGDFVEVVPVKYDRSKQFKDEDAAYLRAKNTKKVIFYVLIGIVAVLIAFIVVRFIIKEMERKKRLREEETLRQQQLEREKIIWQAENADVNVTMSVEDRHKQELQESAITAAKEHPEDVAQLIRTWLSEE